MVSIFRAQPRAFYMVFMLEIWERFGFYTVQGVLTLYFIRFLGFDDDTAYFTFGAFSALVYGMVVVGGYLGDKLLGTKRTIVLGLVVLASGYLSLAVTDARHVFFALGLICVGNGLFKANPSSLLSRCYPKEDMRLHSGFTLYYMAINLGSIIALFAGPALAAKYGYPYAYLLSFVGIMLGLVNYWLQRRYIANINTPADQRSISLWQWSLIIIGIAGATMASAYLLQHVMLAKYLLWLVMSVVVVIYFMLMRRENKTASIRMLVALILMVEAVAFFTLYQQMPTSLNLFAVNNVHPYLFGISINPQSFQALNPIWIILMSPLMAMLYDWLDRHGIAFPIPYKFASGMTLCGLSFVILYFARYIHDDIGMVSSWWLVVSYIFQSLGELLVSALGVAMVAELVPPKIVGFVMGMWFLTVAMAGFIGAEVAAITALPMQVQPGVASLMIYTKAFAGIGLLTLLLSLVLWIASPFLIRLMNQ